uniref:Uncharacterized protein n=1 Tax=Anguilla anguilla TaxID=7936 RepID=A0A0E9PS26_ANGAN
MRIYAQHRYSSSINTPHIALNLNFQLQVGYLIQLMSVCLATIHVYCLRMKAGLP